MKVTTGISADIMLCTPQNYRELAVSGQCVCYKTKTKTSNALLRVPFDGDWYIVVGGNYIGHTAEYEREEVRKGDFDSLNHEEVIVHHAPDTADLDEGDMADYWEEQRHTIANEYICPSCHDMVGREKIDGAHVELTYGKDRKLYIVPTCRNCNRSRSVEKNFVVSSSELVLAPKQRDD